MARQVLIFPKETFPVEDNGLVLRAAQNMLGWRNKYATFANTGSFRAARLVADAYDNLVLTLNADSVEVWTGAVTSGDDFVLTDGNGAPLPSGHEWHAEVETPTGLVRELHLYGAVEHPVAKGVVRIVRGQAPWTWLAHQVQAVVPTAWTCGRILANGDVTLTLYAEDAQVLTRTVSSREPFRLPRLRPERRWRVDLDSDPDTLVQEIVLATSLAGLGGASGG